MRASERRSDKQQEAIDRHEAYQALSPKERLKALDKRLGKGNGAIRARTDDWGVIPGSMATGTYIVQGLGNPASYDSASHGAGRRMSRGQARRELTVESLTEAMDGKTWNGSKEGSWGVADAKSLVDEHPLAYKDIESVMEAQSDLVVVRHQLTQLLNYKGV